MLVQFIINDLQGIFFTTLVMSEPLNIFKNACRGSVMVQNFQNLMKQGALSFVIKALSFPYTAERLARKPAVKTSNCGISSYTTLVISPLGCSPNICL